MKVNGIEFHIEGRVGVLDAPYGDIPAGYRWDGASIPRRLHWWGSAFDTRHVRASLRHDWDYETGRVPRLEADTRYYRDLVEDGLPEWKAAVEFLGVRLFGSTHYNRKEIK